MIPKLARRIVLLAIGLCLCTQAPTWSRDNSLRLGIMPYAPDAELMHVFGDLQDILEQDLDIHVELLTAPDYMVFMERTLAGMYDVVFASPHIALLAVEQAHWKPLVRSLEDRHPVFVVRAGSEIEALADLRGRTVATPDRLSLVTLLAEGELERTGLVVGSDVTVKYASTHHNAMLLVARGLADAAVAISPLLEQLPAAERAQLRVLQRLPSVFALACVCSPTMDARMCEEVRTELLRLQDSNEGQRFLGHLGTPRYLPLDAQGLRRYSALLPLLDVRLKDTSAK